MKGSKLIVAADILDCMKHWRTDNFSEIKNNLQCLAASNMPKEDGDLDDS